MSTIGKLRDLAKARPLLLYFAVVMPLSWAAFLVPLTYGVELSPSKLGVTLLLLFGGAVAVSALRGGRPEVRKLFAGIVRWRIGVLMYCLVLTAIPLLTLLVAAATDQLQSPDGGWLKMTGVYLLMTLVVGALILNLWEETAWGGFVQQRLMDRHGVIVGPALTALPFALIHLPLVFEEKGFGGTTARDIIINLSLLIVVALCFRYIAGRMLIATAGSTLAVGLLHASFNASGSLGAVKSQIPGIIATAIIAVVMLAFQLRRGRTSAAPQRSVK